jgi:hypothetical protein
MWFDCACLQKGSLTGPCHEQLAQTAYWITYVGLPFTGAVAKSEPAFQFGHFPPFVFSRGAYPNRNLTCGTSAYLPKYASGRNDSFEDDNNGSGKSKSGYLEGNLVTFMPPSSYLSVTSRMSLIAQP